MGVKDWVEKDIALQRQSVHIKLQRWKLWWPIFAAMLAIALVLIAISYFRG